MALTNQEYEKIKRIYDDRRLANDRLLSARRKEVFELIPAYAKLEEKTADISMECSRALIRIPSEADRKEYMDKLHSDILDLRMEKKKLLEANGFSRDYLDPLYTCPRCRDTGFIDGEKCSCFKQLELEPLYDGSQIKELLKRNNFSLLSYDYYKDEDLKRFEQAVKTCRCFVDDFGKDFRNLLFYGTVGTGKSFLSCCIAKELLDRGRSIIYFSAQQLFQSISSHYYDKEKDELNSLYERIYGSELLIIDDLGTEMVNEFTRTQLFTVLNERALRSNPVVVSTNLDLDTIRRTYSDRIFSRLADNSIICHLTGRDIRIQKKIEKEYNKPN
ncbi:MAG: ATP-binding protein [Lachnospiraceae bacterium]|nr:ATP-binding protein [Lachnospiraceae bacterium]